MNTMFAPDDGILPPLPTYKLTPLPPLVSPIPDKVLTLLLPVAAYWGLSMFFHWLDTNDYLPQYRLHTPAEVLKRNRVSRWEVIRDVLIQQAVQTGMGIVLILTEPEDTYGKEDFDIAVWTRRVRAAQKAIPWLLSIVGVNSKEIASHMATSHPLLARALSGGYYPSSKVAALVSDDNSTTNAPGYVSWEVLIATAIYYYIVPMIQFGVGLFIVDTWDYFLHRILHMNQWLYTHLHSRHHRLYVPYAYGALYNHPVEGFLMDILGTTVGYKLAGMSTRQSMWFFTGLTIKTVDDHCGYALPWDPLQHITANNAPYHDIHHQSWGIKTNFSQPISTFWDRMLGTSWTGGDISIRYERARLAAQKKMDEDQKSANASNPVLSENLLHPEKMFKDISGGVDELELIPVEEQQRGSLTQEETQVTESRQQVLDDTEGGGFDVLLDESREERDARLLIRDRRRQTNPIYGTESLKGLRDRVSGIMHGRASGIIGMESNH